MRKCLNYDLADLCDCMIHQGNPLIITITVQTSISENYKELAI